MYTIYIRYKPNLVKPSPATIDVRLDIPPGALLELLANSIDVV
jgi:hypothetical protein